MLCPQPATRPSYTNQLAKLSWLNAAADEEKRTDAPSKSYSACNYQRVDDQPRSLPARGPTGLASAKRGPTTCRNMIPCHQSETTGGEVERSRRTGCVPGEARAGMRRSDACAVTVGNGLTENGRCPRRRPQNLGRGDGPRALHLRVKRGKGRRNQRVP